MCPPNPCGTSPAVAGHESPPFRRDTKRPLRGLQKVTKGMALRATTKAGLPGVVCVTTRRGEDAAPPVVLRAGVDALGGAASRRAPPKAEAPRWGEPHRAGRASARLRCGTGARKDDNGPTDAAPETFVLGRRPISCPAKRGFVSTGSGGDAAHRKGMGWRRPMPRRCRVARRRSRRWRRRRSRSRACEAPPEATCTAASAVR